MRVIFIQTNLFCHYLTFLYSGHINFVSFITRVENFFGNSTNQAFPFAIFHFLWFRSTIFWWLSAWGVLSADTWISSSPVPVSPFPRDSWGHLLWVSNFQHTKEIWSEKPHKIKSWLYNFQKDPAPSAATPGGDLIFHDYIFLLYHHCWWTLRATETKIEHTTEVSCKIQPSHFLSSVLSRFLTFSLPHTCARSVSACSALGKCGLGHGEHGEAFPAWALLTS